MCGHWGECELPVTTDRDLSDAFEPATETPWSTLKIEHRRKRHADMITMMAAIVSNPTTEGPPGDNIQAREIVKLCVQILDALADYETGAFNP